MSRYIFQTDTFLSYNPDAHIAILPDIAINTKTVTEPPFTNYQFHTLVRLQFLTTSSSTEPGKSQIQSLIILIYNSSTKRYLLKRLKNVQKSIIGRPTGHHVL